MKLLRSKRPARKEEDMQMALAKYIMLKYPDVIFTAEASGVRTSYVQAAKMKMMRSNGSHLDMIILEPRGLYAGCILELKHQDKTPFLLDGSISKSQHVQAQAAMMERLRKKGYYSSFAVGLDQALKLIDRYMNQPTYGIREQRQPSTETIPENGRAQ
jgi:hypothetical protein